MSLIERLHRLFLEVVRCELDNLGVDDINNVQALVLYNLGEEKISIGELTMRGCYLGSNVSYNLKKMVQNGYIEQTNAKHDKRSYIIRLSPKGLALCRNLDAAFTRHVEKLEGRNLEEMKQLPSMLKNLAVFWKDAASQRLKYTSLV